MNEPVRVAVGACRCPGTPHSEDAVFLEPHVTIPMGAACLGALKTFGTDPVLLEGAMARAFRQFAIRSWTFTDKADRPIPIEPASVDELLPFAEGGFEVQQRFDELYAEAIFRPLVARALSALPGGPTGGSTSANPATGRRPRKHSKPSLPNGSADGTLSAVPVP